MCHNERALLRPLQALGRVRAHMTPRLWLIVGAPALVLLLGAGLWAGGRAPAVHAAAVAPLRGVVSVGRASPPDRAPTVGHWSDPQQQTAYTVHLQESAHAQPGQFVYLLPNGSQVRGVALLQQQVDGTLIQQASSARGACAQGELALTRIDPSQITGPTTPISASALAARSAGPGYATPVIFALTTRIGQYSLVAYAGLSYALADDAAAVESMCAAPPGPSSLNYQMSSGCTADVCTDPLASAGPSAVRHDGAMLHAASANTPDAWRDVYTLSARSVTGQYGAGEFATIMSEQIRSKGRITNISPLTSAPTIQFDAAGQAYYAVTQSVTLDRDGTIASQQITSYYLLEGGTWLFWFST